MRAEPPVHARQLLFYSNERHLSRHLCEQIEQKKAGRRSGPPVRQLRFESYYGSGVTLVPTGEAGQPLPGVRGAGQTKTPPTGPMTPGPALAIETAAAGEQPLPSQAASKST